MKWIRATGIRAARTFLQTFLGFITVGVSIKEIDLNYALSVSAVAFFYSVVTALIAGLPELEGDDDNDTDN